MSRVVGSSSKMTALRNSDFLDLFLGHPSFGDMLSTSCIRCIAFACIMGRPTSFDRYVWQ